MKKILRSRKFTAVTAGLVLLVGATSMAAAADEPRSDDGLPAALEEVGARYSSNDPATVIVNLAEPGAEEALLASEDELDGLTIQIEGIEVLSAEERRLADETALGFDPADLEAMRIADELCPPEPSGTRGDALVPYLGCDPKSGPTLGPELTGTPAQSLAAATAQVLETWTSITTDQIFVTEAAEGRYQVDLPRSVGEELSAQGFGVGSQAITYLNFTGYSHSDIAQVTFTIEGDCLAFNVAIGGDMCAPLTFNEISELSSEGGE